MSVSDSVGCGWMLSLRSVASARHLDGEHAFGDQLARAGADDADAEDAFGVGIDDELGQAVRPIDRERAAERRPRELRDLDLATLLLARRSRSARTRRLRDR